jgi:predicted Co/Zn/Cd cation transporter (cation efflux family)
MPMTRSRRRKLIGTVLLVVLVSVYALVAMAVGSVAMADKGRGVQLAFFTIVGLGWVLPAALIIWWMERPRPEQGQ